MLSPSAALGVVIALAAGASAGAQAVSRLDVRVSSPAATAPASGPWVAVPGSPLRGRVGPHEGRSGRRVSVGGGGAARAAYPSARAASSWGQAIEVPGLAALNAGGNAGVASVSCSGAGDCAAGGSYRDGHRHDQGFVDNEWHGHWRRAIEVPGLGRLNKGGAAYVWWVSCASPGNCTAGGSYRDAHGRNQGFVGNEWHGHWRRAIEVPGLGHLNAGGNAQVDSVSCPSPGNCAVGGTYRDHRRKHQGFVAAERRGRWGQAIEVAGLGHLNEGDAGVTAVGCGSAGNCAAGGTYDYDGTGRCYVLFGVIERAGRWSKVAGTSACGWAYSISCPSAGHCLIGGIASEDYGYPFVGDAFVMQQRAGRWGAVRLIPGMGKLEHHADPEIAGSWANSVACTSVGNCAVGGAYEYNGENDHGFVAVERKGAWARAIEVPGLAALNAGRDAAVTGVSCGSAADCAAGGYYRDASRHYQGFVAVERNGT